VSGANPRGVEGRPKTPFTPPNFYFHLAAAYAILCHKGVPLAKPDYLGEA